MIQYSTRRTNTVPKREQKSEWWTGIVSSLWIKASAKGINVNVTLFQIKTKRSFCNADYVLSHILFEGMFQYVNMLVL